MKTREFIKKVEGLGLLVFFDRELNDSISILIEEVGMVALIKVYESYHVDTNYPEINELPKDTAKELFDLIYKYAVTPVNEREETKYRYRLNDDILVRQTVFPDNLYLYSLYESSYVGGSEEFKTSFTNIESKGFPKWVKLLIERGHLNKEEVDND